MQNISIVRLWHKSTIGKEQIFSDGVGWCTHFVLCDIVGATPCGRPLLCNIILRQKLLSCVTKNLRSFSADFLKNKEKWKRRKPAVPSRRCCSLINYSRTILSCRIKQKKKRVCQYWQTRHCANFYIYYILKLSVCQEKIQKTLDYFSQSGKLYLWLKPKNSIPLLYFSIISTLSQEYGLRCSHPISLKWYASSLSHLQPNACGTSIPFVISVLSSER